MTVTVTQTIVRPTLNVSFWPQYLSEYSSLTNEIHQEFSQNGLVNIKTNESDDDLTHTRITTFANIDVYNTYNSRFNSATLSNNYPLLDYKSSISSQYYNENNITQTVSKNLDT